MRTNRIGQEELNELTREMLKVHLCIANDTKLCCGFTTGVAAIFLLLLLLNLLFLHLHTNHCASDLRTITTTALLVCFTTQVSNYNDIKGDDVNQRNAKTATTPPQKKPANKTS